MDPSAQGSDRVAALAAYFRQHGDRFTRQALRAAATEAGYSATEIEAAWSQVGWGSAEQAMSRPADFAVSAGVALAYIAGTYLGTIGLASNSTTAGFALPGVLVAVVGGVLAWAGLRESRPAAARGIGLGIVVTLLLPVVLFLLIVGICIATGAATPF